MLRFKGLPPEGEAGHEIWSLRGHTGPQAPPRLHSLIYFCKNILLIGQHHIFKLPVTSPRTRVSVFPFLTRAGLCPTTQSSPSPGWRYQ